MGYSSELDTIKCSVDVGLSKFFGLYDRVKVQKDLTAVAANVIRTYGVKVEELPAAQLGGGGLDTLIHLLKTAWEHKDLIAFIGALIGSAKTRIIRMQNASLDRQSPRLVVYLGIDSNKPEDAANQLMLAARIKMLKSFADAICLKLAQEYPVFLYDQSLDVHYRPKSYFLSLKLKHEHQSRFNTWRLHRVADSVEIIPSAYINYQFGRVLVRVSKGEAKAISSQGWSRSAKTKKSYLFFSGKA